MNLLDLKIKKETQKLKASTVDTMNNTSLSSREIFELENLLESAEESEKREIVKDIIKKSIIFQRRERSRDEEVDAQRDSYEDRVKEAVDDAVSVLNLTECEEFVMTDSAKDLRENIKTFEDNEVRENFIEMIEALEKIENEVKENEAQLEKIKVIEAYEQQVSKNDFCEIIKLNEKKQKKLERLKKLTTENFEEAFCNEFKARKILNAHIFIAKLEK